MSLSLKATLKYSRPRFWLYLAGPFLIGLAAGAHSVKDLTGFFVWIFLIYFLFPANLLVYGINDIYDYETDKLNPKKRNYEQLVTPDKRRPLLRTIVSTTLPFLALVFSTAGLTGRFGILASFIAFLFFSIFYSAPPIRAKTKPLLDSAFNILYLFPGWFGFYLAGGQGFNWHIFLAGMLWVMAMHAFSAVPDIVADGQAGLHTIATVLGKNLTLLFCALCYLGAGALAFTKLGMLALVISFGYVLLMAIAFQAKENTRLFRVYTWFPWINAVVGFVVFAYMVY
jgi:4-hydroxybenzoate polyprenyltransferase